MCNIVSVTDVAGKYLLNCTQYDGVFDKAKTLTIIASDNEAFNTDDFLLEKTRPCFSGVETPWIMLNHDIPAKFLKSGNQIVLQ